MYAQPTDLSLKALSGCLQSRYNLAIREVTFLPLGFDSNAWVYRARTLDGGSFFLKAFRREISESSLLVPRYLRDAGVSQVIAPLPVVTGALRTQLRGYSLVLYPYVEGCTGKDIGLAPRQWVAFGEILRKIHDTALDRILVDIMPRESFSPPGAAVLRDLDARIREQSFDEPAEWRLAAFWTYQRDLINRLLERAEDLGRRLAATTRTVVLCHADIHTANVLVDGQGQIWIVDWDEAVMAPRERDLMFVLGGGINKRLVGAESEELFLQGYGSAFIDPDALVYYRYAWAVSDISAYGSEVLLRPDLGRPAKQAAADRFMGLFSPGEIVSLALSSPHT